jgi:hypothetical protein
VTAYYLKRTLEVVWALIALSAVVAAIVIAGKLLLWYWS